MVLVFDVRNKKREKNQLNPYLSGWNYLDSFSMIKIQIETKKFNDFIFSFFTSNSTSSIVLDSQCHLHRMCSQLDSFIFPFWKKNSNSIFFPSQSYDWCHSQWLLMFRFDIEKKELIDGLGLWSIFYPSSLILSNWMNSFDLNLLCWCVCVCVSQFRIFFFRDKSIIILMYSLMLNSQGFASLESSKKIGE